MERRQLYVATECGVCSGSGQSGYGCFGVLGATMCSMLLSAATVYSLFVPCACCILYTFRPASACSVRYCEL